MHTEGMKLRTAVLADLPRLTEIYNEQVLGGLSTFDVEKRTPEDRLPWFDAHNRDNHPLIVCEDGAGNVLGYASLSAFRAKDAYSTTCELSVYVAPEARRKGVASLLMQEILDGARADERTHSIVSVVTGHNEASMRLHEKFGFTRIGVLHEVARKFGEWQDTVYYELLV